jgi:putative transcriptional regulator
MGLVINRESHLTLAELAKSQAITVAPGRDSDHIFVGGPVEPYRGFVLHDSTRVEERAEVLPGLYLSTSSDALGPLLSDPDATVRLCLGYSGWGAGQVESELKQGSWLFTEATSGMVLAPDTGQMWQSVIKGMGIDPGWLVTTGGLN